MAASADSPTSLVNPAVLRWARERSALSAEIAARRVKVETSVLLNWENGADVPSLPRLRQLASLYKRPLPVFFLPEVPHGYTLIHDYRVPGGGDESPDIGPKLAAAIRTARDRRSGLLDLLEEEPAPFPVTASVTDDPE